MIGETGRVWVDEFEVERRGGSSGGDESEAGRKVGKGVEGKSWYEMGGPSSRSNRRSRDTCQPYGQSKHRGKLRNGSARKGKVQPVVAMPFVKSSTSWSTLWDILTTNSMLSRTHQEDTKIQQRKRSSLSLLTSSALLSAGLEVDD
jgi:hypothetical protein